MRGEEPAARRLQLGAAELGDVRAVDPAAELERQQLGAVTDAEGRDAELEQQRIELRRAVRIDGRRAARENQGSGVAVSQVVDRRPVRDELRVDARLPDPPCDQLRVLAAEVDDQDRAVLRATRAGNWAHPS